MAKFPMFKGFTETTKLHGIPRVGEGSKPWIVFWAVLFGICVGMAVNDLYFLVTQYQSEPTSIQMALTNLAPDYNWTTPTLCMEIAVDYIDDSNNGLTQYQFSNPSYDAVQHMPFIVDGFLKTFYNIVSTDSYTDVAYMDAVKNPNLIYFPYMVLGYLVQLEQQLMNLTPSSNYQFTFAENDPLAGQHLQPFYDMYVQRNVSMSTLTQLIGMWHCLQQLYRDPSIPFPQIYGHMENYRYFGDSEYISLPMCKANMITHLGFGMVCSKVFETPNVPIIPDYNQFIIYDTLVTQRKVSNIMGPNDPAAMVPNLLFHLDLQGRNVIPEDRKNVFSWSPGDNVVLDISVSAEYQFLNTQNQRCSSSPFSQSDCIWQKRVASVYQQCGCWPSLADIQNPKSGLNCSVNPTNLLLHNIYNINMTQFCPAATKPDISDCILDCHLFDYSFTRHQANRFPTVFRKWTRLSLPTVSMLSDSGSMEFRFGFDYHNIISERYTADWANFLGTWGGSIGTWLGASVLAFIHIPVYIFRQYAASLFKSKANVPEAD